MQRTMKNERVGYMKIGALREEEKVARDDLNRGEEGNGR